jgi:hypothetical protein
VSCNTNLFKSFRLSHVFKYSNRRAASWIPAQGTATRKILIGIASTVLVGGILAAVIVQFAIITNNAQGKNTERYFRDYYHGSDDATAVT